MLASRKNFSDDWTVVRAKAGTQSEIRWCQDIRGEPGNEREIICEVYTQDQRRTLTQNDLFQFNLFPRTLVK